MGDRMRALVGNRTNERLAYSATEPTNLETERLRSPAMLTYVQFLEMFPEKSRGIQEELLEKLEAMREKPDFQVDATTARGETGLFLAIYEGMEQVAMWFLSQGADPWIVPDIKSDNVKNKNVYLSSSPVHYAFRQHFSMAFLRELLACDPKKSTEHIQTYRNEYVFKPLLDLLVFRGFTWFRLSSAEIVERIQLLIEYDAIVSYDVYGFITARYYSAEDMDASYSFLMISKGDLKECVGAIAYQYMKHDLKAVQIQRVWRRRRLIRATKTLQCRLRERIYHPDHVWKNGKTTLERVFAGKNY